MFSKRRRKQDFPDGRGGNRVRKRPTRSDRGPRTSNFAPLVHLWCLKRAPKGPSLFLEGAQNESFCVGWALTGQEIELSAQQVKRQEKILPLARFHWSGNSTCQSTNFLSKPHMADRLRHCAVCPECSTRYLIGFSPYLNGSCLVSFVTESSEEYKLLCACHRPPLCSRWNWRELKGYIVSNAAYARGYGSPKEVWLFRQRTHQDPGFFNANLMEREGNKDR